MIVAVYKEEGLTSRDVVNKIKKITGEKKTGHAGTLDPLASGVLVIGIGRESTKKLHTEVFDEKEYLATIKLGEESSTGDREGERANSFKRNGEPSQKEVDDVLVKFTGVIKQTPSIYSAVKIKGKEAYKYARKGKSVDVPEREVVIKSITIVSYQYPLLKIKVVTGKGAYIRSLAVDIGKELCTGGFLLQLERTRVGGYTIKDCKDFSFFENFKKYDNINNEED